MEPAPKSPESWSLVFTIINSCGSALAGILGAVWYMRGIKDDHESLKNTVRDHHTIIFKERGGLALLSEDAHNKICQTNQEAFGKDLELVIKDISHMKETLTKIEQNSSVEEIRQLRDLMSEVLKEISALHKKRSSS